MTFIDAMVVGFGMSLGVLGALGIAAVIAFIIFGRDRGYPKPASRWRRGDDG